MSYIYKDGRIVKENTIKNAVQQELNSQLKDENISKKFDSLKEIAEYLSKNPVELETIKTAIEGIPTQINSAINKLNVEDTAIEGQYISSVSESAGKIQVTHSEFPAFKPVWSVLEEQIVPGYLCYKINGEYKFIDPNKQDPFLGPEFKGVIMSINNDNTFTMFYPTYYNTYVIELRETADFEYLSNSLYWDENSIQTVIKNIGAEKLKSILSKLEVPFQFPIFTDLQFRKGSAVGCKCIYEDGSTNFKWNYESSSIKGTVLLWEIENINYVK